MYNARCILKILLYPIASTAVPIPPYHTNRTTDPHLASAIDVGVENTQDVLELGRDNERLPKEERAKEGQKTQRKYNAEGNRP